MGSAEWDDPDTANKRMADPELYQRPDEARETARRHAELQAGMDALYEEWEALSEAVSER